MSQTQITIHEKLTHIGKHSGRVAKFRETLVKRQIDPFLFFYEKSSYNQLTW